MDQISEMHKSVIKPHAVRTGRSENCPKAVCGRIREAMEWLGLVPVGQVLSYRDTEVELHGQRLRSFTTYKKEVTWGKSLGDIILIAVALYGHGIRYSMPTEWQFSRQ